MRRRVITVIACCTLSLSPLRLAAQRTADFRPTLTGTPRRLWPSFALGGALIGGVTVAGLALAQCDQGCKDDGSLAMVPPYLLAGAVIGALIGGLVGLIVDDARQNAGQSAAVAAP